MWLLNVSEEDCAGQRQPHSKEDVLPSPTHVGGGPVLVVCFATNHHSVCLSPGQQQLTKGHGSAETRAKLCVSRVSDLSLIWPMAEQSYVYLSSVSDCAPDVKHTTEDLMGTGGTPTGRREELPHPDMLLLAMWTICRLKTTPRG